MLVGHHRQKTFEEEFIKMLRDFEVDIVQIKMFDFFLPDPPTCDLSEVSFNPLFAYSIRKHRIGKYQLPTCDLSEVGGWRWLRIFYQRATSPRSLSTHYSHTQLENTAFANINLPCCQKDLKSGLSTKNTALPSPIDW